MNIESQTVYGDSQSTLDTTEKIEKYVSLVEALPNEGLDWDFSKHANILLILLGERPAAEIKFRDKSQWTWRPVLKEIGLSWVEEDRGSWSVLWITDDADRLENFDSKDRGFFLGYPEFAVKAFNEQEEPSAAYLRENYPEDAPVEYYEYKNRTWLVSYVPPATKEGVESRLATQESYESALESCGVEPVEEAFEFARQYHESSGLTKLKLGIIIFIRMIRE